jgi:hypothetical protein
MPSAVVSKFNPHGTPKRPHRHKVVIDQVRHALEQLEIQSEYPNRGKLEELPWSEISPWPTAFDEE